MGTQMHRTHTDASTDPNAGTNPTRMRTVVFPPHARTELERSMTTDVKAVVVAHLYGSRFEMVTSLHNAHPHSHAILRRASLPIPTGFSAAISTTVSRSIVLTTY